MITLQLTLFVVISSLGPGLASQSIMCSSLSPLHCVSLPLPSFFSACHHSVTSVNLKLITTQQLRNAMKIECVTKSNNTKSAFCHTVNSLYDIRLHDKRCIILKCSLQNASNLLRLHYVLQADKAKCSTSVCVSELMKLLSGSSLFWRGECCWS